MGGMEFNKILAAVLVAGIIAMLAGFISKTLTHPHKLAENAYKIEGVETAGGSGKAEKMAEPILAMLAAADVERGQKVAKACAACHNFEKGGANGVGPNLYGVVGAKKQNHPGFTYSGTLNGQGGDVWTYAELNKFLWKPKAYASGTKMNFVGLKKPEDRAAVIAWLRTLADSPKALPGAVDIAAEEAELALPTEDAQKVEEAIETVKQGTSAEEKSLEKTQSDIKKLQSDADQTKAIIESKKQEVKKATETIKDTVKSAH
ncbi:MAG TPA: cytochrome c family protein [Alphaproteobacteria bacterium]|nr:cytochrome c family protein [Alphaproteobacteria bacterium]